MTEVLHLTVGGLLENAARRVPEHDALLYPDRGLRYSYRELNELCDRVAGGLLALGIKRGDHLAIWATNVPEWVILQFATARIGAVLVAIHTSYKSSELEYVLRQSDSTTLFLVEGFKGTDFVETLNAVVPELKAATPGRLFSEKLPCLKNVVFIGEKTPAGMLAFRDLEMLGERVPEAELSAVKEIPTEDEVINLQYTSGTTGFSKGVMLTHHNLVNNGFRVAEGMRLTGRDRLCLPVPLFHRFGCVLGVLACVTHGAAIVPVETFDPERVLGTVETARCTALHGVPAMFIAELEVPAFSRYDLSSLRTGVVAGSPCPSGTVQRLLGEMHISEITVAYGQTESSPAITQTRIDDPLELRVSTVGRALPHVEVKIVDTATGSALAPGREGELCTRGDHVMKGYYKMPEETARVIDAEGWLHTGDLAILDENGYCRITGRIRSVIVRGGEKISPRELEEFLRAHPKVSDVRVCGVPDSKYDEQVMASVQLKAGVSCTAEEIRDFCRGRIADYKIPRYVTFVEELP